MKKLLLFLVIVGGIVGLSDGVLNACGSKFLVGLSSPRYQRLLASIKPTSILVYWKQDADTKKEDRWHPNATKTLEKAGHTVEVTFDADAFRRAAPNGDFDVVMMKLEEARALKAEMASLSPDSAVLPIAHFPTRSEYSQAKKEFGNVLRTPTTGGKFLTAVEKSRSGR